MLPVQIKCQHMQLLYGETLSGLPQLWVTFSPIAVKCFSGVEVFLGELSSSCALPLSSFAWSRDQTPSGPHTSNSACVFFFFFGWSRPVCKLRLTLRIWRAHCAHTHRRMLPQWWYSAMGWLAFPWKASLIQGAEFPSSAASFAGGNGVLKRAGAPKQLVMLLICCATMNLLHHTDQHDVVWKGNFNQFY